MQISPNTFKQSLQEGRLQLGLFSLLPHHVTTEVVAACGFDSLILDTEHGPNDALLVLQQLHAMRGSTTHAIVRPSSNDSVQISKLLDVGVQTLLVPHVDNVEDALRAVAATRHAPYGNRGFGPVVRAAAYGRIADYAQKAPDQICVLAQIETREALDSLEAIAAVDGIDGLFVGPGDLSADMGYPGQATLPEMRALFLETIRRIRACGKPAGIVTNDENFARQCIEAGVTFLVAGADIQMLASACEATSQKFRGLAPAPLREPIPFRRRASDRAAGAAGAVA